MQISENLPELLRRPFGGQMGGHIEVQNPARADLHRHEHIKDSERRGDRNEEIAGDNPLAWFWTKVAQR